MYAGHRCGRPIYESVSGNADRPPVYLCLMHSHDPKKDKAAFHTELDRTLQGGTADFRGFVFPGRDYVGTKFRIRCFFREAIFTQGADFSGATFSEGADFSGATFTRTASFCRTNFGNDANFREARFAQAAEFREAKFTDDARFREAKFTEAADFSQTTFTKGAQFDRASFAQGASFIRATFTQDATFFNATFTQGADFFNATFTRGAFFNDTTFTTKADFRGATFTQGVYFVKATFTQDAYFAGATFAQGSSFAVVTFTQRADFSWATLTHDADFQGAVFRGEVHFRETVFRHDETQEAGPIFAHARFEKPEAVTFSKTYLGQALFHNCDVSKFVFTDVRWRRRERGIWRESGTGKRMVFEEEARLEQNYAEALRPTEQACDERNHTLIAELYQQLKKNYDDGGTTGRRVTSITANWKCTACTAPAATSSWGGFTGISAWWPGTSTGAGTVKAMCGRLSGWQACCWRSAS